MSADPKGPKVKYKLHYGQCKTRYLLERLSKDGLTHPQVVFVYLSFQGLNNLITN